MAVWTLPTVNTQQQCMRAATTWSSVNVPTSSSAHTKGAWTQIIASTGIDASMIQMRHGGHSSTGVASPALVDIGVGGSGSELVVVPDVDVGFMSSSAYVMFPVAIPAGSRIAMRAQGARTSVNIACSMDLYGSGGMVGGQPQVARWTNYGIDAANSRGTAVTPGNSNSWGSWVDLGATTYDHDVWNTRASFGANNGTTAITYRVQAAFGANSTEAGTSATNETALEGHLMAPSTSEVISEIQLNYQPVVNHVPAGTHVWVRAMASGTAQTLYVSALGGSF